jgi:hypothetical protein
LVAALGVDRGDLIVRRQDSRRGSRNCGGRCSGSGLLRRDEERCCSWTAS